ncbi:MAG: hypothetical protein Q4F50_11770 [Bacteroides sp.]|uniref:hypothetical protein n=1 Tax=Bacteroides sp. TaxID=29523 RepID=UPI0026E0820B|nr:hypothetical protein [Bacteroides sp.]MDO5420726.1 hypothetical protein [Bacteroides sp.]
MQTNALGGLQKTDTPNKTYGNGNDYAATDSLTAFETRLNILKERLKHTDFEARYTLKPTEEGTPSDGPIKRSMQSSTGLRRK